jgi:hypothetical protein
MLQARLSVPGHGRLPTILADSRPRHRLEGCIRSLDPRATKLVEGQSVESYLASSNQVHHSSTQVTKPAEMCQSNFPWTLPAYGHGESPCCRQPACWSWHGVLLSWGLSDLCHLSRLCLVSEVSSKRLVVSNWNAHTISLKCSYSHDYPVKETMSRTFSDLLLGSTCISQKDGTHKQSKSSGKGAEI